MDKQNQEMISFMAEYLSMSDVYAAKAIATVSAALINYRKAHKMTQKDFAKMMEVSQSMVSKWESAEYNFTIANIAHIAEKLNMTFSVDLSADSDYFTSSDKKKYRLTGVNQWPTHLSNGDTAMAA